MGRSDAYTSSWRSRTCKTSDDLVEVRVSSTTAEPILYAGGSIVSIRNNPRAIDAHVLWSWCGNNQVNAKFFIRNMKNLLHSVFSRSTFAPVQGLRASPLSLFSREKGDDSLWACSFALAAVFGGLGISASSWSSSVHASPFNHTLRNAQLITVKRLAEEAVCARCLPG